MAGPSDLVSFLLTGGNEDQTSDNVNFGNFPTGTPITTSGGSVTSVGLSMPADFTITNSPVISTGTLTATRANQTAGLALMGPTLGSSAAAPSYRYPDYPDCCEGRLTLSSTLAVPTSDQTAKTTIYFLPYSGDLILLYNGSTWQPYLLGSSGINVAVPSTRQRNFDVFIYDNSGTLTLETVDWATNTATNSPTAGSNVLINVATTNCAVGDVVTIQDGTHTEVTTVISFVSNTSIHCNLVNSYTTPTICWQARATAITQQNGVYCKSGTLTHRYLGTCRTTATSGQCEDSALNRLVWNYEWRVKRPFFESESTTSWTYNTSSWRQANGNTSNQVTAVIGVEESIISLACSAFMGVTTQNYGHVGIGIDSTTAPDSANIGGHMYPAANCWTNNVAFLNKQVPIGYHFFAWLETVGGAGGVQTFYSTATYGTTGISGWIEA